MLLAVTGTTARAANELRLQEQEIKAGLLYNFLKYTQWPKSSQEKIIVCLLSGDAFKPYLQPMAGRTVNQREIALSIVNEVADAGRCHLLFISANKEARWPELRNFLAGKPVLTVSDAEGFSGDGGMIEFGRKGNHISVSLHMDTVVVAGLRVQERLLKLVTVVRAGGNP